LVIIVLPAVRNW